MDTQTPTKSMQQQVKKPTLTFWQIWNLSFGFLGVQIGYSLQNGNVSRVLAALGADVHHLGYFWLAAPIAGLLVQPIVGLFSDSTWTRLGRRIPFILGGAIVSALAMFFMPNAEHFAHLVAPVFFGGFMLLLMDSSFNVTMQPFRALVGDMVNDEQRDLGYSTQSFLINVGAVLGSLLPFLLTNVLDVANEPAAGEKVADSVVWSFYIGGGILLATVLWTAFTVKEYPPKEYALYHGVEEKKEAQPSTSIAQLIKDAPASMWTLAVVQFFSWFALFLMWVYTTPAIAQHVWGTLPGDATSKAFNEAGNWTGVIFAFYSAVAALWAVGLPKFVGLTSRKFAYAFSLIAGGIGLVSMFFVQDQYLLLFSMVGIGMAWTAILAMPYAILSGSLPAEKMGLYMGLFNGSITLPQIAAGFLGGSLLLLLGNQAIAMLALAGVSMFVAAATVFLVKDEEGK